MCLVVFVVGWWLYLPLGHGCCVWVGVEVVISVVIFCVCEVVGCSCVMVVGGLDS